MSDAPSHVGPYQILGIIGSGGMGTVYKGFQASLNRIVAIKILPPQFVRDPERVERFHREAQAVALLSHPNIVQIIDKGREGDLMYFVMEYIDGSSLDAVMAKRRMSLPESLRVIKEIAKGLQFAHSNGIIHRDLKPRNVLISADLMTIKLTDFGISRIESLSRASGTLTTAQSSLGTLFYFAPEQAEDPSSVDHRADVYSLGVIVYELLTGKVPVGKFKLPSELNTDVSSELDSVVLKCLAYDKTHRYSSVQVFLTEIETLEKKAGFKLVDELRDLSKSTSDLIHRSTSQVNRHRSMTVVAAIIALLLLAGGAFWYLKGRRGSGGEQTAANTVAPDPASLAGGGPGVDAAKGADPVPPSNEPPAAPPIAATPVPDAPPPASKEPLNVAPDSNSNVPAKPAPAPSKAPVAVVIPPPATAPKPSPPVAKAPAVDPAPGELDAIRTVIANKQYDQALSELKAFSGKYPGHQLQWDAEALVANVQERQGRVADAMATYREISARYPNEPRTAASLFRLAQLTLQTPGKEQEGRQILGEIVQRYPNGQWFLPSVKAKAALEERLKLKERDPVLLVTVPSALVSYRTLVEHAPTDPTAEVAFWKLGEAYDTLKRYDLAAQAFANLGSNFPNTSYDAWFRAGELYEKRINDRAAAQRAYTQVPQRSQNYKEAQKRAAKLSQ